MAARSNDPDSNPIAGGPRRVKRLDLYLAELEQLYDEVRRLTIRLDGVHAGRLRCVRGCSSCCVEGITVFEIEARNIERHHLDLLARGAPNPEGACAFLDGAAACRIYPDRPYVCRTQGYPLRWLSDAGEVEMRDICPLNDAEELLEELDRGDCWSIGPFEERLAGLQVRALGSGLKRVLLRSLFRRARSCRPEGPPGPDRSS